MGISLGDFSDQRRRGATAKPPGFSQGLCLAFVYAKAELNRGPSIPIPDMISCSNMKVLAAALGCKHTGVIVHALLQLRTVPEVLSLTARLSMNSEMMMGHGILRFLLLSC